MKFFEYIQNNSGGAYKVPALRVYIEAASAPEADERAAARGIYFDGVKNERDCKCCGDRWVRARHGTDSAPESWPSPLDVVWDAWAKAYKVPIEIVVFDSGTVYTRRAC